MYQNYVEYEQVVADYTYGSQERMRFTFFLSMLAHVILLFGVGITYTVVHQDRSIEVTIVGKASEEDKKKQADFIAQHNQEGGGTEKDRRLQFTTTNMPIKGNNIEEVLQKLHKHNSIDQPLENPNENKSLNKIVQNVIVTSSLSHDLVTLIKRDQSVPFAVINPFANSSETNDKIIEALESRLAKEEQKLTKMQKTVTVSAVSAKSDISAKYTYEWIKKIEHVGNAYYPQIATQYGLEGQLRMLVAIKQNGHIDYVRILQSSGFSRLDDAAVRIVRVAAPFDAMSPEMKQTIHRLQIVRTWIFKKNRLESEAIPLEEENDE